MGLLAVCPSFGWAILRDYAARSGEGKVGAAKPSMSHSGATAPERLTDRKRRMAPDRSVSNDRMWEVHRLHVVLALLQCSERAYIRLNKSKKHGDAARSRTPERENRPMAFLSHVLSPAEVVPARAPKVRSTLLQRVLRAMMETRRREADREIARYLHLTGGKMTDSIEREIERRVFSPASRL
jgi:hypothetical protein